MLTGIWVMILRKWKWKEKLVRNAVDEISTAGEELVNDRFFAELDPDIASVTKAM